VSGRAGQPGRLAAQRAAPQSTHTQVNTGASHGDPDLSCVQQRQQPDRVSITRNEAGDLIIHPLRARRGAALLEALEALADVDAEFVAALEAERANQPDVQEREPL
jgi:antitoxin VapB